MRALFLHQVNDAIDPRIEHVSPDDLPAGEVLVDVLYSSLNFKDGLAVTGQGKIIRGDFPFVPGIDLVGRVRDSETDAFAEGDLVVQTGGGLGERRWGGYSQVQRLPTTWLVPLPESLTPHQAMVAGTAGYTAMLSVMALEDHGLLPDAGEVLVTGASGGVGSVAVAILAQRGYTVVASTGSEEAHGYLTDLGAARLIDRHELSEGPAHPMESARWAGAVDAVGGDTLATVLAQLDRHAAVAACGNAGGASLATTVFPFILRGVALLGIDSNTAPLPRRKAAWLRLGEELSPAVWEQIHAATISLDDVPSWSATIMDGGIQGRVVVDVNA